MSNGSAESVVDARPSSHAIRRQSSEKIKFYSNCLLWAIYTFLRRGGFLIISKSEWGWWPHIMWTPDMRTCHQFEPDHKRRRGRLWPPIVYRGYIKKTHLR